jgi:curved DNA-binding protein CbpA
VPKRSPYEVLGVDVDASGATIKAAWRRLARQHHPDTTAGDAAAARAATRRMAEINAAYEELRDPVKRRAAADRARGHTGRPSSASSAGEDAGRANGAGTNGATTGRSGPPRPKPTRPVTARLDTSDTYAPRNQTVHNARRSTYGGNAALPPRNGPEPREAPRASDPTGPLRRSRVRHFRPPPIPGLADAQSLVVDFGKFHGHTLGEIAAFEPSYIDWLAGTITRNRELVVAARVIQDDLDARGVPRIRRVTKPEPSPQP